MRRQAGLTIIASVWCNDTGDATTVVYCDNQYNAGHGALRIGFTSHAPPNADWKLMKYPKRKLLRLTNSLILETCFSFAVGIIKNTKI